MAKYDDASWHYGGDYPKELPAENGATHIGMFLSWCIQNDLTSKELADYAATEIQQLKDGKITGAAFLLRVCDEKLTSYELSDTGKSFADDYYEGETAFSNRYNGYMDDYLDVFDQKAENLGFEYETVYHIEDTPENYNLIKDIISQRFKEWQQYNATKPPLKRDTNKKDS